METCNHCGASLQGQPFCTVCGAKAQAPQVPAQAPVQAPVQAPAPAPVPAAPPMQPVPPASYLPPVQTAAPPRSYPPPAQAAPMPPWPPTAQPLNAKPPKGSPYAVVGAWGFVGYAVVMAIPLVGFILAIVWAASSSGSLNRRNYARAMLLIWLIAIVVCVVCAVFFWSAFLQLVNFNYNFSYTT